MNYLELIMEYAATILLIVAGICTLVSIITETTKEIGFLNRIPTVLQVWVITPVITLVSFFAYMSFKEFAIRWYYIVVVVFASFIMAFITCKGWDALINTFKRFYKKFDK